MDMATALMLTTVALFQNVESPVGHVKSFDVGGPGVMQDVTDSIAEAYQRYSTAQLPLGADPEKMADQMVKLAARLRQERTIMEEQEQAR